MSYQFKQILLPPSKHNIKAPYKMTPVYITVHNTANDASAANEVAYHNRNNNQVSYHVAVDDIEVIQCLPFDRNAWHCGDGKGSGNMKSIGIEICYSKSGGDRYKQAEENAVQYIAKLLKEFGWGIDRVKKHQDWSGKNCPHRILSEGRWTSFLKRIQDAMAGKVETKKEDEIMLNKTGRTEARELIKRACKEGVFDASYHTDERIAKYSDGELISYHIAYTNRVVKP